MKPTCPQPMRCKGRTPTRVTRRAVTQMTVFGLSFMSVPLLTGCLSFDLFGGDTSEGSKTSAAAHQHGSAAGQHKGGAVLREVPPQTSEPPAAQRDVASLQTRVASQERQIAQLRSEVALIKRGLKTGLFEPVATGSDMETGAVTGGLDGVPALDLGFEDTTGGHVESAAAAGELAAADHEGQQKTAPAPDLKPDLRTQAESPYDLIESAIKNMERRDYPAALVTLTAIRDRYPGYADEGLSDVLTAESWNALKAPEKALPSLERFVAVHGSSKLLPRAKLAQADAHAALGERQKSLDLLMQVIALAPETQSADSARARLASMRDVK